MFVRLVACKTHASVHGVFSAGQDYQVSDEKGAALLDLASETGDQYFVEVQASEAAPQEQVSDIAENADEAVTVGLDITVKPTTTKVKLGGHKKHADTPPAGDDTTVTV